MEVKRGRTHFRRCAGARSAARPAGGSLRPASAEAGRRRRAGDGRPGARGAGRRGRPDGGVIRAGITDAHVDGVARVAGQGRALFAVRFGGGNDLASGFRCSRAGRGHRDAELGEGGAFEVDVAGGAVELLVEIASTSRRISTPRVAAGEAMSIPRRLSSPSSISPAASVLSTDALSAAPIRSTSSSTRYEMRLTSTSRREARTSGGAIPAAALKTATSKGSSCARWRISSLSHAARWCRNVDATTMPPAFAPDRASSAGTE